MDADNTNVSFRMHFPIFFFRCNEKSTQISVKVFTQSIKISRRDPQERMYLTELGCDESGCGEG